LQFSKILGKIGFLALKEPDYRDTEYSELGISKDTTSHGQMLRIQFSQDFVSSELSLGSENHFLYAVFLQEQNKSVEIHISEVYIGHW
jgi:hypothetical protein